MHNNSFQAAYQNGTIRSTRARITWRPSTDPDFLCYRVFRNNVQTGRDIDSAHKAFLIDSLLQQNTWYKYTIATVLRNGLSTSDTVTIRTPAFLPPSLTFQPRIDSTGKIYLGWTNRAETAQRIVLERRFTSDPTFSRLADYPTDSTAYVDYPIASTIGYFYRLSAWNQFEHTAYTETAYVLYSMYPPTALAATQLGTRRAVMLTFNDNSTAETGFRIYRKHWNGSYAVIGYAPANATQFIDADSAGFGRDSSFYYKVECYNRLHTNASPDAFIQMMKNGIDLSPSALEFPNTAVGYSKSMTLTIRNTYSTPLVVSNVKSSNPRFVPGSTSFTVPAGSSATLSVTFSPTDYVKESGYITLTNTLAIGGLTIPVSGTGTGFRL